jgi:glycerate-2-kinase
MHNTNAIIARQNLHNIYQQALHAIAGDRAVCKQLQNNKLTGNWYLIAIGKAAAAMTQGALTELQLVVRGLVISKHQHIDASLYDDTRLDCIESDHPVPGDASFEAGEAFSNVTEQVTAQFIGVIAVIIFTTIMTIIILKIIDMIIGLRVDEEQETEGLDITQHEERGYIL